MNRLFYLLAAFLILLIIVLLNSILEFEIENAQKSNEHVENFAREKLNLSYPDEEFISFENEVKVHDE